RRVGLPRLAPWGQFHARASRWLAQEAGGRRWVRLGWPRSPSRPFGKPAHSAVRNRPAQPMGGKHEFTPGLSQRLLPHQARSGGAAPPLLLLAARFTVDGRGRSLK